MYTHTDEHTHSHPSPCTCKDRDSPLPVLVQPVKQRFVCEQPTNFVEKNYRQTNPMCMQNANAGKIMRIWPRGTFACSIISACEDLLLGRQHKLRNKGVSKDHTVTTAQAQAINSRMVFIERCRGQGRWPDLYCLLISGLASASPIMDFYVSTETNANLILNGYHESNWN